MAKKLGAQTKGTRPSSYARLVAYLLLLELVEWRLLVALHEETCVQDIILVTWGCVADQCTTKVVRVGLRDRAFKKGGRVNTSRENRLEELGRVDAERGRTRRGKKNLREEKSRIVRELGSKKFGNVKNNE